MYRDAVRLPALRGSVNGVDWESDGDVLPGQYVRTMAVTGSGEVIIQGRFGTVGRYSRKPLNGVWNSSWVRTTGQVRF